jgi:ParB family chromosome partitioning protein
MTKSNTTPKNGDTVLIPLNKLKKSPKNVRKVPHTKAEIEALAASIGARGLLQNLVVEPEARKARPTGFYLVTIGEGRRLAHLLRAKRKEIAKDEPVRCVIDADANAEEISLAENVIRSGMHPADEYEAFATLHRDHGMSAEDIGARFGVTPAVVRQRLKLGAVSPKLIAAYRDGKLNLEQLMGFAITDDHAAQERVWKELPHHSRSRAAILDALTEGQVPGDDRRAIFIGPKAYRAAGGAVVRDLFDREGGGYFADAALLSRLVREKLQTLAHEIIAEGWKWVSVEPEYDYERNATLRRIYPEAKPLSDAEQEKLDALEAEYNALCDSEGDDTEDAASQIERLEAEIAALTGAEQYRPEVIAMAGAIVSLGRDGESRIERGFIRPEDDAGEAAAGGADEPGGEVAARSTSPHSDKLVAELTAHRTAALRTELARHPAEALVALVHALAAATFYSGGVAHSCLDIRPVSVSLTSHAPGIEDSPAGRQIAERHEAWKRRLPERPAELWAFIGGLDDGERLRLLAHCTALTVDAVRAPKEHCAAQEVHVDDLARAVALDMTQYWQPTEAAYFGRVSKTVILDAVREAVSPEAADNLAGLKKAAMAQAAAQRLSGKGWLPALLRTPEAAPLADQPATMEDNHAEAA